MRLVIQRCSSAQVTVEGEVISSIGPGIMCLVGLTQTDGRTDVEWAVKKILGCKLWANDEGKPWRRSVVQKSLQVLIVSQFTLYGTLDKKNRPDYRDAMSPDPARSLYEELLVLLHERFGGANSIDGEPLVQSGVFGAMMSVALVNDGPVTLVLDSPSLDVARPGTIPCLTEEKFTSGGVEDALVRDEPSQEGGGD
mmetsp:Transcript_35678/g.48183  ORF Transcript_35678/g.48183 Transcript_35678/m.48183 type:complete len:196 (-) Transcript_35678:55-642(-)